MKVAVSHFVLAMSPRRRKTIPIDGDCLTSGKDPNMGSKPRKIQGATTQVITAKDVKTPNDDSSKIGELTNTSFTRNDGDAHEDPNTTVS